MKVSISFSTTNSLASRLIRWITNGKASHVYLKIYDQTFGADFVLHSDYDGIQIGLLEKFALNNFTLESFVIDDHRLDDAVKKNLWHLGKSYDYYQLFDMAWAFMLKRWFVRKIKEPTKDPRKIICVDFVLYIFNQAGLTCLPIGLMSANDLLNWCRENYETFKWERMIFEEKPGWLR